MQAFEADKEILIVDDNDYNRRIVEDALESEGFTTLVASGGQQALDLFVDREPALVLLDIMMPGLNGFEICAKIRELPQGQSTAIVFMSALDDLGSHRKAVECGGDDILSKPLQLEELLIRVRSQLWIQHLRAQADNSRELFRRQRSAMLRFRDQDYARIHLFAHRLRDLLATQLSNAYFLAQHHAKTPELLEASQDITDAAHRMNALIHEFVTSSEVTHRSLVLNRKSLNISPLLTHLIEELSHRLRTEDRREGITIDLDVEPALIAHLDEDLFERLVRNLLDYALQNAPPHSAVEVQARRDQDGLLLNVTDRGPSIPEALRETIFNQGRLTDAPARPQPRNLAFCRIVAVEHGGTIWADTADPGTRISVLLPD